MQPYQVVAIMAAVFAFVILAWVWTLGRSRSILERWAADSDLELTHAEFRLARRGPFFWRSGKHVVYYIVVRDRNGQVRRGYARVGGWFLGILSRQVTVEWESGPPSRLGE